MIRMVKGVAFGEKWELVAMKLHLKGAAFEEEMKIYSNITMFEGSYVWKELHLEKK
jgi:hypothetical protein